VARWGIGTDLLTKKWGKQPPRGSALLTHAASLHAPSVHALRLWVEWDIYYDTLSEPFEVHLEMRCFPC